MNLGVEIFNIHKISYLYVYSIMWYCGPLLQHLLLQT